VTWKNVLSSLIVGIPMCQGAAPFFQNRDLKLSFSPVESSGMS